MYWILYVRYALTGPIKYQIKVRNKEQLFSYIGYLYSTSIEKIERIDYDRGYDEEASEITGYDFQLLQEPFKYGSVEYVIRHMIKSKHKRIRIQNTFDNNDYISYDFTTNETTKLTDIIPNTVLERSVIGMDFKKNIYIIYV